MSELDKAKDESSFNQKYGAQYAQYHQKRDEYATMVCQGAARFLSDTEVKKEVANKIVKNYTDSKDASLFTNLNNQIDLFNLLIEKMNNGLGQVQDEEFKKEQAKIQAEAEKTIQQASNEVLNQIYAAYFTERYDIYVIQYQKIVNDSAATGDYQKKLEETHSENSKVLEQMITYSQKELEDYKKTESPNPETVEVYESQYAKNKLSKNAEDKAYNVVSNEIKKQKEIAKSIETLVKQQCENMVAEEFDDSKRQGQLQSLRDSEAFCRKMSRMPQDIIDFFDKITAQLFKLICGIDADFPNLAKKNMLPKPDIEALKAKVQELLNPVLDGFKKLSIPFPPILTPVINLLQNKDDGMKLSANQLKEIQKLKDNFKIPAAWKSSLQCLVQTIYTIILMMPTLLIQLIFNMIGMIVKAIKQLGAPTPYPLNLVPDAIELVPKLYELQKNFPQIMMQIAEDKMKELGAKMHMFGVGNVDAISKIQMPTVPSPSLECPEALKQQLEAKYAKDNAEKLQKEQQEIDELNKSIESSTEKGLISSYATILGTDASKNEKPSSKEDIVNDEIKKEIKLLARKYMPITQLADPTQTVDNNKPKTAEQIAEEGRASYGR